MLRYIGNGSSLPRVPARDLSDAEVKLYGKRRLLESGLYQEIRKRTKNRVENSQSSGGANLPEEVQ